MQGSKFIAGRDHAPPADANAIGPPVSNDGVIAKVRGDVIIAIGFVVTGAGVDAVITAETENDIVTVGSVITGSGLNEFQSQ